MATAAIHQLEAWSTSTARLRPWQAQAVAEAGLADVRIAEGEGEWQLVADSRVGVVGGREWGVTVVPRLAIPKLMFLLGYAADPRGWRQIGPAFAVEDDLFTAVASGFAVHAERALTPAPIRGYRLIEDRATAFRGRLRVADQIARSAGLPLPLEVEYDEYTEDIAENRLVRGAAELLLRHPHMPSGTRKRLLRVRAVLQDVAPAAPGPEVAAPPLTRLNDRYAGALHLAELVLRGSSIRTVRGEVSSISFVFDMNTVFEDFLSTALRGALARFGGRVQLQHRRRFLDAENSIRLIPDITWWSGDVCEAVIDAKYKPLADKRFPNADAYQMLAYCTAFQRPRGYLVYAKEPGVAVQRHHVGEAEVTIDVSAIDVEHEPDQVLGQVAQLAQRIARERTLKEAA